MFFPPAAWTSAATASQLLLVQQLICDERQMMKIYVGLLQGEQIEAGSQQGHMFIQPQAVCC